MVVLAAGLALGVGGCGCDSDRELVADIETVEFVGELVDKRDRTLVFRTDDGDQFEVYLASGRSWPLEEGDGYLVEARPDSDGRLWARTNGYCSNATIRHADGGTIDTSYLAWAEEKVVFFVIWGGGALVALVVIWGSVRWLRDWSTA